MIPLNKRKRLYSNPGSEKNQTWSEIWDNENKKWEIKIIEEWNQYDQIQIEGEGTSLKEMLLKYKQGEIDQKEFRLEKHLEQQQSLDTSKIPKNYNDKEKLKKEIEQKIEKIKTYQEKIKTYQEKIEKEKLKKEEEIKFKEWEKKVKENAEKK